MEKMEQVQMDKWTNEQMNKYTNGTNEQMNKYKWTNEQV